MAHLIIVSIFLTLIALAFWLPFRQGKTVLSIAVASVFSLLLIFSLATELGFLTTILMFIMMAFLVIFVSYWIGINLNYPRVARIVAIILTAVAILPFLSFALEDYFFFKSDARKFLAEDQIVLHDDFEIKSNHITGLDDIHQKFELDISAEDKERIIQQLKHSIYFQDSVKDRYVLSSKISSGLTSKIYLDFETEDHVYRETYQKLKIGYVSDYDIITISKTKNTLIFERIND